MRHSRFKLRRPVRAASLRKADGDQHGEGRAMSEACRRHGTALVVNHQRRTAAVFHEMRRLMESGAIGRVQLIRGGCQGDILSDGTHLIDTIRYLVGDAEAKWVFGQVYRRPDDSDESGQSGFRYGHAVESGAYGLIEFENGIRAEIHTGKVHVKGRHYQDYEIFGSEGVCGAPGTAATRRCKFKMHKRVAGGRAG
jgi:predicted dehydrogenase